MTHAVEEFSTGITAGSQPSESRGVRMGSSGALASARRFDEHGRTNPAATIARASSEPSRLTAERGVHHRPRGLRAHARERVGDRDEGERSMFGQVAIRECRDPGLAKPGASRRARRLGRGRTAGPAEQAALKSNGSSRREDHRGVSRSYRLRATSSGDVTEPDGERRLADGLRRSPMRSLPRACGGARNSRRCRRRDRGRAHRAPTFASLDRAAPRRAIEHHRGGEDLPSARPPRCRAWVPNPSSVTAAAYPPARAWQATEPRST